MAEPDCQAGYKQWLETFNRVFGTPITFLNIDINWPEDNWHWQQSLQQVARFARDNHLQIGIIYNAAFPEGAKSDEQWLNRAVDNVTQIEGRMNIVPDRALFESWAFFPKRAVSEQGSLGEDYLVKRYLKRAWLRRLKGVRRPEPAERRELPLISPRRPAEH
jgi:hypothetical protein